MNQKVTSATPDLLNSIAEKVVADSAPTTQEPMNIVPPSDNLVLLPGGYINAAGEVIKTAEVRELTGRDEEFLGKMTNFPKALSELLERAVISIGDEPITPAVLDRMLSGDRDALLLGIYKATFGEVVELNSWCEGCKDVKTVEFDIDRDIEVRTLRNPIADREFTVKGKKEYTVILPTGVTYKELADNSDKTGPELKTILLEQTVTEINGQPVISKTQVRDMSLADRRKIEKELSERNPGPKFEPAVVTCPDCEGEVVVPINLGALFRF